MQNGVIIFNCSWLSFFCLDAFSAVGSTLKHSGYCPYRKPWWRAALSATPCTTLPVATLY